MRTRTIGTPGIQQLAAFQSVVQQQEGIFGPLIALGTWGQSNTMTMAIGPSPANRAVLEIYEGEAPLPRAGHAPICQGDCFVEGRPAKVVAYRLV
jgi:hypothetical protein